MRFFGLVAAVLWVASDWAGAAPLDLKQVPAAARWIVLLDVDGIRAGTSWRPMYEAFWKENAPALGPIQNIIGLDLKDNLHGLTIYATRLATKKNPQDFRGAAIVSIDCDRQKLVEKLKTLAGDKSTAHGSHQIFRWEAKTLYVSLYASQTIVVSMEIEDIERALDVLDGKALNITQTDSSLATVVPVGAVLLARGLDLEQVATQLQSPLLRQCKSLSLAIGEHDKHVFADVQAWMTSTDTAQQIEALVNGYRALVQLQTGSQAEATKMLEGVRCVRSDKVVSLSLRLATSELPALLKHASGSVDVKIGMQPVESSPAEQTDKNDQ